MYLKYLNKIYWYIGIVLYLILFPKNIESIDTFYIYLVSVVTFILFGIIISETNKQNFSFFTKQNLVLTVFSCSILEVILYQTLSSYIDGDTFVFSKSDALQYFNESLKMSKMGISESFSYISQTNSFDDLGAFTWISTMFRIVPSHIFLTFSYCIIGSLSAAMLFDIGRCLMPRRYAYMAALTFSIASFTTVYHALCLKETIFTFLVIASFHSYYFFMKSKKNGYIVLTLLCTASILLFRIPVALFMVFSFGFMSVLTYFKGPIVVILSASLLLIIYSSSFFEMTYERYLVGGDIEFFIDKKNRLAGAGSIVEHLADPLAAMIGPFPSVAVKSIQTTPLHASGLLYRLLLAIPFIIGTYFIFRYKYRRMYPLILFFLINAVGVAISVKGLEVRLSIPHLAMAYLVAFWWIAKYDYRQIRMRLSRKFLLVCLVGIISICVIWNLRF